MKNEINSSQEIIKDDRGNIAEEIQDINQLAQTANKNIQIII